MVENDFMSILKRALKGTLNNPLLIGAGFLASLLAAPELIIYSDVDETLMSAAAFYVTIGFYILILPAFTGGMLGYALEYSKTGASSLKTFLESAKKNYVRLLLAGIIALIAFNVLKFAALLIPYVALFAGDVLMYLLFTIISFGALFIIMMLIEFYDVMIIDRKSGILKSFKDSYAFIRTCMGPAVIFFFIIVLAKFAVQLPLMTAATPLDMAANSTSMNYTDLNSTLNASYIAEIATISNDALPGVLLLQVIIQTFVFAFVAMYKSEFYLARKDGEVKKKKITDFDYDFNEEEKKA